MEDSGKKANRNMNPSQCTKGTMRGNLAKAKQEFAQGFLKGQFLLKETPVQVL